VGREAGEDDRDQRLLVDVAAGVAVGEHVEGGRVLRFEDEAAVQAGLERALRAIRDVAPFRDQARAKVFPEPLDAILEFLDAAVVEYVADEFGIVAAVE